MRAGSFRRRDISGRKVFSCAPISISKSPLRNSTPKIEELRALVAAGEGSRSATRSAPRGKANLALKGSTPISRPGRRRRSPSSATGRIYPITSSTCSPIHTARGRRKFAEDAAIQGGFARFRGESVCLIGHEKGSTTEERIKAQFRMARPEGYRKAVRIMELADRFDIPVIALVDTAGRLSGIDAKSAAKPRRSRVRPMLVLRSAFHVAVIIGEGGSGGAIAIATANVVLMLEHAIYSVISPKARRRFLARHRQGQEAAPI